MTTIQAQFPTFAPTAALVALYNLRAEKPVRRFENRATAEARLAALAEKIGVGIRVSGDEANPVLSWDDPEETHEPGPVVADEAPKAEKKAKKASGGKRGPAPTYADDLKVEVVSAENPKREGSASAARFALYSKVGTVGAYLEECARLQGGTAALYRGDIAWDAERKYIKVG